MKTLDLIGLSLLSIFMFGNIFVIIEIKQWIFIASSLVMPVSFVLTVFNELYKKPHNGREKMIYIYLTRKLVGVTTRECDDIV